MVTANEGRRHEDYARRLGVHAYLNKPIDFGALAALMGRVSGGRDAVAQMAAPPSEASVAA